MTVDINLSQIQHKLICYAEVSSKITQIKLYYRMLEHKAYNEYIYVAVLRYCCVCSELSPIK